MPRGAKCPNPTPPKPVPIRKSDLSSRLFENCVSSRIGTTVYTVSITFMEVLTITEVFKFMSRLSIFTSLLHPLTLVTASPEFFILVNRSVKVENRKTFNCGRHGKSHQTSSMSGASVWWMLSNHGKPLLTGNFLFRVHFIKHIKCLLYTSARL